MLSQHEIFGENQPVEVDDIRLWVWGTIVGCDAPDGYSSRHDTHPNCTDAEYCAHLYQEYGQDFVKYLNSEFVVILYDPDGGEITICTDRLGTRPVFYTITDERELVFSTQLQTLPEYPSVKPSFEDRYLYEFFSFERAIGTRTPISNVEKLPPASITTVDIESGDYQTNVYWRPEYQPVDRPYSYFVQEFADIFKQAVIDRTQDDANYGVLLSGGIDSRIILAAMDSSVTGHHMNEWMNQEAELAKKISNKTGNEFDFLQRDVDYQEKALGENPAQMNFVSSFDQGQATNFRDEISEKSDVIMSGLYSDVLYQHQYTPTKSFEIPVLGEQITLPMVRNVDSIDDYRQLLMDGQYTRPKKSIPAEFFEAEEPLAHVLKDEIFRDGNGIVSHGVKYPSATELIRCSYYYPITNSWSYFFHQSLIQMQPFRNPFLDIRLLDLQHKLPIKYHARTNIVNDALCELSSELANIPHANNGISPSSPFLVRHFGSYAYKFNQRYLGRRKDPSEPHHTNGSWTDDNELIRLTNFIPQTINQNENLIQNCDQLQLNEVWNIYEEHMDGEDRRTELYPLATFLQMPITKRILESSNEAKNTQSS
ncbi:asparagine synthase [Natronolimnohabitans innermongolicus JCM 12255]|uniref:Asparagine synthase n=1 Tax=Natronolimnohabitans innermongolicus JCM 12255 TaxID=1227499 RepID=L9XHD2_9EURY|nr:asparagine synthase [Natronolimnohabitans innermongolicus JCM 12255]